MERKTHPLILSARQFAIDAHESVGQVRKYTGDPYYTHVIAVAEIVGTVPGATPEMIAAAYLHDTVEDTNVTIEEIAARFGPVVSTYVEGLTNCDDRTVNRKARKAQDILRLKGCDSEVQTIKCADIIHNCGSIVHYDPDFGKRYLKEGLDLLMAMSKANSAIWSYAHSVVGGNMKLLGMV